MKQLAEHALYTPFDDSTQASQQMHDNLMLDDDYGGLLLDGKPALFKDQSSGTFNMNSTGETMFSKNNSITTVIGSGINIPAGFKPV